MKEVSADVGYFVFSLDTEFAWGTIDWDHSSFIPTRRSAAQERETICRLLDLMNEFGVVATWAVTGHLFYETCEKCDECPLLEFKGKDQGFDQVWGAANPLWYGADMVQMLLARNAGHEIACHGHTHRFFNTLSRDQARYEIQEWVRLAQKIGVSPQTVIFPQGRIAHLDLFQEAGFICYRGKEVRHPLLAVPLLGKVLNQINLRLAFLPPQVFDISAQPEHLVNVPSSLWLFRTNRKVESVLDSVNLPYLRFYRAAKSIQKAAEEKKVIHLWAHPHEFQTEKDFDKLRYLFSHFADQAQKGRLKSITMAALAAQTLKKSQEEG